MTGDATIRYFDYLEDLGGFQGLLPNLFTEITTSTERSFACVDFVDTPGLVDGDMKVCAAVWLSIAAVASVGAGCCCVCGCMDFINVWAGGRQMKVRAAAWEFRSMGYSRCMAFVSLRTYCSACVSALRLAGCACEYLRPPAHYGCTAALSFIGHFPCADCCLLRPAVPLPCEGQHHVDG